MAPVNGQYLNCLCKTKNCIFTGVFLNESSLFVSGETCHISLWCHKISLKISVFTKTPWFSLNILVETSTFVVGNLNLKLNTSRYNDINWTINLVLLLFSKGERESMTSPLTSLWYEVIDLFLFLLWSRDHKSYGRYGFWTCVLQNIRIVSSYFL